MKIERGHDFTVVDFTTSDLVAGVYTLPHGMGRVVDVKILQPTGARYELSAQDILHNDALTSLSIDFGGAIAAGTWTLHWR